MLISRGERVITGSSSLFLGGGPCGPRGTGADDFVEDDQQFSHASGDDHFEGFAGGQQPLGEGADSFVVPFGGGR